MLLLRGAELNLRFVDLKDDEPDFLASLDLQVERADGDLLLCDIIFDTNFSKIVGIAFNARLYLAMLAVGKLRLRAKQGVHGTHCAKVTPGKASGVEIGQRIRHFSAHVELARTGKGLALLLSF